MRARRPAGLDVEIQPPCAKQEGFAEHLITGLPIM